MAQNIYLTIDKISCLQITGQAFPTPAKSFSLLRKNNTMNRKNTGKLKMNPNVYFVPENDSEIREYQFSS